MKKRILFVDDEPRVLDGLRDMLRRYRRIWEMSFAEGGEEALGRLAEGQYDIIVTDMRMPGMDGAALLETVKERYPDMVRIVLSGHTEAEAAIRAVPVAHQYLSKPCDPAQLQRTVERAANLQAILSDERIRRAVGSTDGLPSMPHVYTQLTRALAEPDTGVKEIAAIIEQDMAMCAKLLKLVNSAFFRLAQKTTSIERAVAYLGMNMIKYLTLSVEVFQSFPDASRVGQLSLSGLQKHALLVSRIAMKMLPQKEAAEDAFMGGMLHDVGKLVMATRLPAQLQKVLDSARSSGKPMFYAEEEITGVNHAEIGAFLLGLWGLPHPVVAAVAAHHDPESMGESTFGVPAAVHIANLLAHELVSPSADGCDQTLAIIDPDYVRVLGVEDQLSAWREVAAQEKRVFYGDADE